MKIIDFTTNCEDRPDRVTIETFVPSVALTGVPIKEETIIRLIRQYYAEMFAGSNVIMKRPLVFDYAFDSWKGFRFYWELRKDKTWAEVRDRKIHTDLARRVFLADHAVVSVYLSERKTEGGRCVSCVFNKNIPEGDKAYEGVRPEDGSIGNACPVRPNVVEIIKECREYRLDIVEFLSFETTTSNPIAGVLENGEGRSGKEGEEVGNQEG
jgi:hypothetical protein